MIRMAPQRATNVRELLADTARRAQRMVAVTIVMPPLSAPSDELQAAHAEIAKLQDQLARRRRLDDATISCGYRRPDQHRREPMVDLTGHSQHVAIGHARPTLMARLRAWMGGAR